ncbi:hypothetical protein GCM10011507_28920 [Edaphobacter acidisoli]|uniref:TonB C-terminal domain-containing protein n=2 Tax=Edaphobacter acidisoli TaxID=2040573 RepID=A0A916RXY9_9BACT|nr:hypothetical protein GCM10011507_28920 [Edaphobacter acidisoli]
MVTAPVVEAENAAALVARVQAAGIQNSIDGPGIRPWHLTVSFQLFDDQQKPREQGTMEEWWAGPDLYKISFASPSYTATEIKNKDGLFRTRGSQGWPYMLRVLHQMEVHPMPSDKAIEQSTAKLEQRSIGKVKLDCIHLKPGDKKLAEMMPADDMLPPVEDPTYCFDHDGNALRLYSLIGYLEVAQNRMGIFEQRTVALDVFVTDIGPNVMTAHVMALTGYQPNAADFDTSSPAWEKAHKPVSDIYIGPVVIAGRKTGGAIPHYPETAREQHIQGTVVMTAIVGTDGHIHRLEVVASPDKALSKAAQDAVQTWTYQPYLLYGAPTEVETTITVNFRFG